MIADEIQTGLARTGKMLACDWEEVRPDVVVRHHLYLLYTIYLFNNFQHFDKKLSRGHMINKICGNSLQIWLCTVFII